MNNPLLYIVFCIDSKFQSHDGKVFPSLRDAREFAYDCMKDNYCDKFIIGQFIVENCESMLISAIETFGFATKIKDINQLSLFTNYNSLKK
jgi:hypothetical protein